MNCNLVQKRKNDDNKSEQQPAAKKFQYNMFVSAGTSGTAENDKKEEKMFTLPGIIIKEHHRRTLPKNIARKHYQRTLPGTIIEEHCQQT